MRRKTSRKTLIILLLALLVGLPVGTGVATFMYADGFSYLSGRPEACKNCHVMKENYDSWTGSSHHAVATCNDCHTSGNVFSKYSQKALNGFMHSLANTTGNFPDNIQIRGYNRQIAQQSCLKCHSQFIETSQFGHVGFGNKNCLSCHQNMGHRRW